LFPEDWREAKREITVRVVVWFMKAGQVIRSFSARDGRVVLILKKFFKDGVYIYEIVMTKPLE
jgi:hypothetical protein